MRTIRCRGGRALLAAVLVAALGVTSCTSGSDVSVPQGGGFELVSPGGQFTFSYPVADRKPLGEISGPAVSGDGRVAVSDYPDQVVVLNFWGSWCGPCRAEAPFLAAAATELKSQGVQFVGINVKEGNRQDGADFDALRGTPYPSIYDQQMRVLASIPGYPVSGIPSTVVLDRQHRVAYVSLLDWKSPAALVDVVSAVVAEK